MGMFDYVDFECDCPECGNTVGGFQSKSGDCNLETIPPWSVDQFYSYCNKCNARISYDREPTDKNLTEEGFKAVNLLREIYEEPSSIESIRSQIQEFLSNTIYPKGDSWLDLYEISVQTQKDRWK